MAIILAQRVGLAGKAQARLIYLGGDSPGGCGGGLQAGGEVQRTEGQSAAESAASLGRVGSQHTASLVP